MRYMRPHRSSLEGIHCFLEAHRTNHKRSKTYLFIHAYCDHVGKDKNKGGIVIQNNFKKFRDWFFDKNRQRLDIEKSNSGVPALPLQ